MFKKEDKRIKMSFCYNCGLPLNINDKNSLECQIFMCFECAFLLSSEEKNIFEQDGCTYITTILDREPHTPRWNYPNDRSHNIDYIPKSIHNEIVDYINKPYDTKLLIENVSQFMTKLIKDFGEKKK